MVSYFWYNATCIIQHNGFILTGATNSEVRRVQLFNSLLVTEKTILNGNSCMLGVVRTHCSNCSTETLKRVNASPFISPITALFSAPVILHEPGSCIIWSDRSWGCFCVSLGHVCSGKSRPAFQPITTTRAQAHTQTHSPSISETLQSSCTLEINI